MTGKFGIISVLFAVSFISVVAKADDLSIVRDKSLVEYLNSIVSVSNNFDSSNDIKVTLVRVRGEGECDSPDYAETCPKEKLLIAAALSGEVGDKAVYRTKGMYKFEFVRWRPDVKKPRGKYGYRPVVFEAKAQKIGVNYSIINIKYMISVTPWSAEIVAVK